MARNPRLPNCQLTLMAKYEWLDQLAALPLSQTAKLVAHGLAYFASKNGKDVRPGIRRLMWACRIEDERTVGRAVRELRESGLIGLVKPGGGRPAAGRQPRADEYWLTTHEGVEGWKTAYEVWLKGRPE